MLNNRIILVTGAAGGIGLAAAHVFTRHGARAIMFDRDGARLEREAAGVPGAVAVVGDVTSQADVARAVGALGALHGAFNNAGVEGNNAVPASTVEFPAAEFDKVYAVNVRGLWDCLRAEIPAIQASGGGAIVNTASVLGERAAPGMPAYSSSKHAVIGLTRAAALDYARAGVRVNAVLPGVVDTPMIDRAALALPGYREGAAEHHPMGRLCRPEEVAEAAAWLLSDRASFVTGHMLHVDGGLSVAA